MKISINKKLIDRNKKIADFALYISLALLAIGFYWTINKPELSGTVIGNIILISAFILVQISLSMANRWGKSPRPDVIVANALKGLNDKFTLYIYTTRVPHLLVGPMGVWVINTYYQSGEISFNLNKNRFLQKGGPNLISKYFAQEGIPNILGESNASKRKITKYLLEQGINYDYSPEIVNLFYSDDVSLITKNSPYLCIKSSKLKDYIRSYIKKNSKPEKLIEDIRNKLPTPNK